MDPPSCGERVLSPPACAFDLQPSAATTSSEGSLPHTTAKCWACATSVTVPLIGESQVPSPIFMCGHCGAITDYMHFGNKRPDSIFNWILCILNRTTGPFEPDPSIARPYFSSHVYIMSRSIMRAITCLRWLVVVFITCLAGSVILLGATFILPVTCRSLGLWFLALNHLTTWFLSFNVFWNYYSAIFNTPGSVRECLVQDPLPIPVQSLPPHCFNHYRYCDKCKWYKPPTSHHCNICQKCVVDMDHHCPFINNCVGKGNLRSFILFICWTITANLYCICHCLYLLLFLQKESFYQGLGGVFKRISGVNIVLVTLYTFLEMPWTCLVAVFIVSFSIAMMISIGSLLFLQINHMSKQPPLIPTNDRHGNPITHSRSFALLRAHLNKVMGGSTLSAYLYPVWGPPPGCLANDKKKM